MQQTRLLSASRCSNRALLIALLALPAAAHVDLNAPDGGDVFQPGDTVSVVWTLSVPHNTENWDLFYSVDGAGGPWLPIAIDLPLGDGTQGSVHTFDWIVPDTPSDNVFFRVVQDNTDTDYDDISLSANTIESSCEGSNDCTGAANSVGSGSSISFSGSLSLADNAFELRADGAPAGQTGLFFYGGEEAQVPFGAGTRCVANPIFRLNPPLAIDATGAASQDLDFTAPPAASGPGMITPMSTWRFQFWYRDPAGGQGGFNLSDALAVTFCP